MDTDTRVFKDLLPPDEEGEPHPADLLASLMRAEKGGAPRRDNGSSFQARDFERSPIPSGNAGRPAAPPAPQFQPLTQAQPPMQDLRFSDGMQPLSPEPPQVQPVTVEGERFRPVPPPQPMRALSAPPTEQESEPDQPASGLQRAVRAIRAALPVVQRLLPLLDGNVGTAVSNVLAHRPQPQLQAPPQPPIDLQPLQNGLSELRTQQRDLRNQVQEQNASIKRVEDQLEMVREATDRNTLEQQELIEDLKHIGNKFGRYAVAAFALLAMSIALNVFLYLEMRHLIP